MQSALDLPLVGNFIDDRTNNAITQLLELRDRIGEFLSQGLAQGIEANGSQASDAAGNAARQVVAEMEAVLEIQSPSRVAIRLGEFFAEGFAIGLRSIVEASELVDAAARDIEQVDLSFLEGTDLSNLRSDLEQLQSTLDETVRAYEGLEIATRSLPGFRPGNDSNTIERQNTPAAEGSNPEVEGDRVGAFLNQGVAQGIASNRKLASICSWQYSRSDSRADACGSRYPIAVGRGRRNRRAP